MKKYYMYSLEDSVVRMYYGMEEKIFRLFQDWLNANDSNRLQLTKQVHYISRRLDQEKINQWIWRSLSSDKAYYYEDQHELMYSQPFSQVTLQVYDDHMILECDGSCDGEVAMFDVLKAYDSNLFAFDLEHKRYGWLKPIRSLVVM